MTVSCSHTVIRRWTGEVLGENVYLNIINRAKKYVYICTPYLIIDNEMMTALCLAAKSGVDVRIHDTGCPGQEDGLSADTVLL